MRSLLGLLSVLALSSGACGSPTDLPVCTLIGCDSGLLVQLERTPDVPFRIEVEVPGHSARYTLDCPDPSRCGPVAFFADFTPDVVRVHVTTSAGTRTQTAQPVYEERRPNGPDCPPLCRTARITVALPEAARA